MKSLLDANIPNRFSTDEAFTILLRDCKFLREGTSRRVYSTLDEKYVVKAAIDQNHATCNWNEIAAFLFFDNDRDKLAQIHSWSISGNFLIMEKLDMATAPSASFVYPSWVTDRKPSNIGKSSDGKDKICDYALVKSPDCAYKSPYD